MELWIRADATEEIGLGHVMRTLALAEQARRRNVRVSYVCAEGDLIGLPQRHGFEVQAIESPNDLSWLNDVKPGAALVFDGYHFTPDDFAAAGDAGMRVGAVADQLTGSFPVDVVVNPSARDVNYDLAPDTKVLAGPAYAMVRRAFLNHRRQRGAQLQTVLVTLGGADVAGLTWPLVERITSATPAHVIVVEGPAAPPHDTTPDCVEVIRDPLDVAAVFDRADLAVCAAGSTTWELLCLGLPVALIQVADNQAPVVETVKRSAAGITLGWGTDAVDRIDWALRRLDDAAERTRLSRAGLALVDGLGGERVLSALLSV